MIDRICSLLKMEKPELTRGFLFASGATVPSDGTDGYQTGCLFQHTDGGAGTALYLNEGSITSCDFNRIESPGGSLTLADLQDVADAFGTRLLETGTYSSSASKGVTLSSTNNRPFSLLYDDAGVALSSAGVVRGMLSRILLTVDVAGSTILPARGQLKLLDLVDVETGIYAPVQGYIEVAGTSISKSGATLSCLSASLEIGTALTAASGGEVAGVHVETTGSGTLTATGTVAGILIDKAAGAADWPVGISILNSTNALTITAATTYAIDIQTSGLFRMGVQGTGIPVATATPYAMEVHCESTANIESGATGATAGVYSRYEVSADQTSQCSHISIFGKLRVKKDLADGCHAGLYGYVEISETGTVIGGAASTSTAAVVAAVEADTNFELSTGHLNGVLIDSSVHADATISGTMAGLRIKKTSGKMTWPTGIAIEASATTTAISIGSCTTGISMAGTYTGNGINFTGEFSDHVIDIQPSAGLGSNKALYIGTWGTEAQFDDGGGLFRMYGKPGAGGGVSAQMFVRALTDCSSSNVACQLYADSDASTPGPTNVEALNCFAMLNAGKYLAASTSWMQGLKSIWAKVGADATSVCNGNVAPLWIDNQINCAVGGEEYGIIATTGGSRPDAFIGFETTSSGYDQLLYFDETFNSDAGTCVTTDSVPGTQDARIKVYYDGKQYYLALYR